jgi:mono/diheme cytochrome c family protein
MKVPVGQLATCVAALLPAVACAQTAKAPPTAIKAQAVLKAYCARCHGENGSAKGGFGYILDRDKLIARGKVVPGSPTGSELYERVQSGEMPPSGKNPRPSKDEVAALRQWIEAGAPALETSVARRDFLPESAVQSLILADLQSVEPRQRRFVRYFTLVHLANEGLPEKDLQTTRQALAKLVNSLSWHPRLVRPTPIDPGQTVFRIDVRHYKWNAALWDRLVTAYPYRLGALSPEGKALAADTGTELPYLRADWFIATASRPPLYQDLLQLPSTERALERLLQVDVPTDIKEETVVRAGFNDSGVSKNNRLIQRHDAAYGAFWRSYDFAENTGRQNLFEHPLGPTAGETSFQHAGGEMIFHLPNGLHAYLLADGGGRRIDKGPVEIVSDPKRPDQRVETGISCMSCHARGLIPKADQIRAHVEKNPNSFTRADVETVKALYPSKARLQALLNEDNERYLKALARTGVGPDEVEPVNAVTQRYEATLDVRAAAAELGLTVAEFTKRLKQSPTLARVLGPLRLASGTVQRQVFQEGFAEVVRTLRLDEGTVKAQPLPAATNPFSGHIGSVLAIALTPDGTQAVSGGDDRTIRLWDVASGRELRRFEGHSGEVTTLAFTPDGKRLVSGSGDRTVRLWDVATGKELLSLRGHTDRVRTVAVSTDGKRLASAADDRTIRLWDARSGVALLLTGHARPVNEVAFSPDGRQLLSASQDGTIRLWGTAGKGELRSLEGHTRAVHGIAFSPDGRRALSGGDDRTVRLWDLETGRELRRFEGHLNAVIRVGFTPDGKHALSASSQYRTVDRLLRVWDLESGRELQSLSSPEEVSVGCVALLPDRRGALSGGSGGFIRLWRLSK